MRKLLLIFTVIITQQSYCQGFDNPLSLRTGISYMSFDEMNGTVVPEFEFNINLGEYVSLDYRLAFGRKYFHAPLTAPLAGIFAVAGAADTQADTSSSSLWYLATIIAVLIPEGVSGHIPIKDNIYLSPMVSPLGFEYLGRDPNSEDQKYYAAGNFGIKADFFLDDQWFISAQSIYKVAYSREGRAGYLFGIQVGKSF